MVGRRAIAGWEDGRVEDVEATGLRARLSARGVEDTKVGFFGSLVGRKKVCFSRERRWKRMRQGMDNDYIRRITSTLVVALTHALRMLLYLEHSSCAFGKQTTALVRHQGFYHKDVRILLMKRNRG